MVPGVVKETLGCVKAEVMLEGDVGVGGSASPAEGLFAVRMMLGVMCNPPGRGEGSAPAQWRAHIRSCSPSIRFPRATFLLFIVRPFINTPLEPEPLCPALCPAALADYGGVGSWEGMGPVALCVCVCLVFVPCWIVWKLHSLQML